MNARTEVRLPCLLVLMTALTGTAGGAEAQSDPSPWRFGVTLGGGALVGVVAEYWSDDFGVEARLGTFSFQDLSVRLSPKWRVGTWDGGEASWRVGVQWWFAGSSPEGDRGVFAAFHGVELARVTDGGHVIGGSYNLPLFGTSWGWREEPDDPDEGPEEDADDPESPSPWVIGATVGAVSTLLLGEFTYRYQPNSGG